MPENIELAELLRPFEPRLPLADLVEEVNKLYHANEAAHYDTRHAEIWEWLPPYWQRMIALALNHAPPGPWRLLDFGCGTGFASEQILKHIDAADIEELVCYDPSPEMQTQCRAKLARSSCCTRFISNFDDLRHFAGKFHLVASNSVLHHLPDPIAVIAALQECFAPGGVWLAGHEPSCRFYLNTECTAVYRAFRDEEKRRQFLRPRKWLASIKGRLAGRDGPARLAARDAFRAGLFGTLPSARVITRLVDFHVPRGNNDSGGFGPDSMLLHLQPHWRMLWQSSYAFMGRAYEPRLSRKWQQKCRDLAGKYPLDGANFCSVWQLVDAREAAQARQRTVKSAKTVSGAICAHKD